MNVLIVCGGRNFCGTLFEKDCIEQTIAKFKLQKNNTIIMSGGATGADTIALEWAYENEWNAMRVPAKWKSLGAPAGMERNLEMLSLAARMYSQGDRVVVLALPGGVGTSGMVALTKRCQRIQAFIKLVDRR